MQNKLLTLLTALLLGACATSAPIDEWRDPQFSGRIDNIMIIGVTERSTRRRVFEDAFVDALARYEIKSVPSYELITSSVDLTREQVEQAIAGKNFDAVLVTRLAGVEEQSIERLPTGGTRSYRNFDGYYDHVIQQNNAGYYSKFKVLTLDTRIYDTASEELVWSLQSELIDSSQPRQMIADQITLTIDRLRAQGLLGGQAP